MGRKARLGGRLRLAQQVGNGEGQQRRRSGGKRPPSLLCWAWVSMGVSQVHQLANSGLLTLSILHFRGVG